MSEIFRDRTEGAIARRQDLLRKRRDELVMMPHAVRRVVVARAARAAASMAGIACGVLLLAVALSPKLAAGVAHYLPGINPAVISTAVGWSWIVGVIAFAISRGRSEHRFAVAMSNYVLPGEDLDEDIERLSHERPDKVAREMAQRLEIASAALPVAAAALVLPATLVYVAQMIMARGWPSTAAYETALAMSGKAFLYTAVAGVFAAIAMTQRPLRRAAVAPVASLIGLVTAALAVRQMFANDIETTWILATVAVLAGSIGIVTWRLARERVAIEAQDPTAGAELFTIRGAVRSLRGQLARWNITPRHAAAGAAFGLVLIYAGSSVTPRAAAQSTSTLATNALGASALPGSQPTTVKLPGASSYSIATSSDGTLRITVTFVDGKAVEIRDGLSGLRAVPAGWDANIDVNVAYSEKIAGKIEVTPFASDADVLPRMLSAEAYGQSFDVWACDGKDRPLGLRFAPMDSFSGTLTFEVDASLKLANCR